MGPPLSVAPAEAVRDVYLLGGHYRMKAMIDQRLHDAASASNQGPEPGGPLPLS